jgi:hypothetical protein
VNHQAARDAAADIAFPDVQGSSDGRGGNWPTPIPPPKPRLPDGRQTAGIRDWTLEDSRRIIAGHAPLPRGGVRKLKPRTSIVCHQCGETFLVGVSRRVQGAKYCDKTCYLNAVCRKGTR